ncbi:Gfo/Idh/MocA family protein [Reichenbachiella versicolor]|uniref:Gfo/Idh/MocA family protein n=1 Tax=Reichenbachiella versicolor TaxID=1821036 RepID=UPI001FE3506C|nr:Gfo/Idh/MocA family oxidoreductase [Reichenbachiella versicolor]
MKNRKIRMGMVGGGIGAFIGAVHRMAANLDGQIELVCGAFSSDHKKCIDSGAELFLPPERCYATFEEMMTMEASLPEGERMDIVSIVTPNHMHYAPAKAALENGFPVIIDKPLSFTLNEALSLKALVEETGLPFALTHTYTGYPMVKQAKAMIKNGELGKIKKIAVEYPQGWLTDKLEDSDQKQAAWRTDPNRSGKSGCYGDIGTHAANMAEYVSGLKITKVLSQLTTVVEGRLLDDDANVLLELEGGVPGVLFASQISAGEENGIKVRVYGEKGGIEWTQEDNNSLLVKWHGEPAQKLRAGGNHSYLLPEALAHLRTPGGHPEGYLEAFANIYRNFANAVRADYAGDDHDSVLDYPSVEDGVHGMALVDAVVESTEKGNVWVEPKY